jgi:hypothetical protein
VEVGRQQLPQVGEIAGSRNIGNREGDSGKCGLFQLYQPDHVSTARINRMYPHVVEAFL